VLELLVTLMLDCIVLCPDPNLSQGKGLSNFLRQQYWFSTNIDCTLAWRRAYFVGLCTHLDDVALFHWLVQDQDW